MDGQADTTMEYRWKDRWTEPGWKDRRIGGRTDGRNCAWTGGQWEGKADGQTNGRIGGQMDVRSDSQADGQTEKH